MEFRVGEGVGLEHGPPKFHLIKGVYTACIVDPCQNCDETWSALPDIFGRMPASSRLETTHPN
jgi:hypothetical protein